MVRKKSAQPQVAVVSGGFGRAILDVHVPLDAWLKALRHLIRTAFRVLLDFLRLVLMTCRSRSAVEAENLFLRKQLALFQERKNKARRADDSTRWLMSFAAIQISARPGRHCTDFCTNFSCKPCEMASGSTTAVLLFSITCVFRFAQLRLEIRLLTEGL